MSKKALNFKLVILGGEGSGKTSLLKTYQGGKLNVKEKRSEQPKEATAKIDLQALNDSVQFLIQDLPGKESFIALSRMYLRDANVALIIYDVNYAESLDQAEKWLAELRETAPSEIIIALAGSKRDTAGPHAVSLQDGQNFAKKHQIPIFFEVSSKTKENID